MLLQPFARSLWSLPLLCAVMAFAYPDSSDSTAFLYGNRDDGSIFRKDLRSSAMREIVAPRTGAAPAMGLLRGSSDAFSLLYGDTAIHRQKLVEFGLSPKDEFYSQAFDSAVAIVTDPWSTASNSYYVFQSRVAHHAVSVVSLAPVVVSEIAYLDLFGYTTDFLDGAVDELNQMAYALHLHKDYNSTSLYRWSFSGGVSTSMLPVGASARNLLQFVLDASRDTAIFYDDSLHRFVRLSLSTSTWTDTSVCVADTVLDFALARNGDLVWSNGLGIYRSAWTGASPALVASQPGVNSIALDEQNVRPHIDGLQTSWKVAAGGTLAILPPYGKIMDNEYDQLRCGVSSSVALKTKMFVSGCSLYVDAKNVAAGNTDQPRFIVADPHGGRDTVTLSIQVVNAPSPAFVLPLLDTVYAYADGRWRSPILNTTDSDPVSVDIRRLVEGANYLPAASDTDCTTRKEAWIAQVFQSTEGGELYELTMSAGYPGPVLLRLYSGNATEGTPMHEEYFSGGAGLNRTFIMERHPYLSPSMQYTLVQIPLVDSMVTFCQDTVGSYANGGMRAASDSQNIGPSLSFRLRFGLYEESLVNLSRGPDTLSLGYVASDTLIGKTSQFRVRVWNGVSSAFRDMSIMVLSGVAPVFKAGADVRIPMRVGYVSSSSSAEVREWLSEVAASPRQYTYELLDSANRMIDYLWVDKQGTLHINSAESKYGTQALRMKRCYEPNLTPCSKWDTVQVVISRPPGIVFTPPDSLVAGSSRTVNFRATDPDVGDVGKLKVDFQAVQVAASQSVSQGTQSVTAIAQSFQAARSGPLVLIQVKAAFPASVIPVYFYSLTSSTWSNAFDSTQSRQMFVYHAVVKTSTTPAIQNIVVPEVYLDSGKYYGVILGSPDYIGASTPFVISMDLTGGAFRGEAYQVDTGALTSMGIEKDLLFQAYTRTSFYGDMFTSVKGADTVAWTCTPQASDVATPKWFVLSVSDGTAQVAQVFSTRITMPVNALKLELPTEVRVASSPYERRKYYLEKWAIVNWGENMNLESRFLTAEDSLLLEDRPWLDQDGSLVFGVRQSSFGTSAFRMRLCNSPLGICSAWDTTKIRISRPPEFSPQLPATLLAGTDTTLRWKVIDRDTGDIANAKLAAWVLQEGDQQTKQTGTYSAKAVGQFFQISTSGALGEIRVFAKFKESFVQYMVGDSARLGDTTSHGSEAILEGHAVVKPDTLMWHSIPIHGDTVLKTGVTYQFSVGYGGSLAYSAEWGIDTTNSYTKGSMMEWVDDPTSGNDSNDGDHSTHVRMPRYDLMFGLGWKKAPPAWITYGTASKVSAIEGTRELRLRPAMIDTGSFRLLIGVGDGVARTGSVHALRILPGDDITGTQFAGLGIIAIGQAVQFLATGIDEAKLASRFTLTVSVKGGALDTSFVMQSVQTVWVPVAEGKYAVQWSFSDALKTYKTGKDTFQIRVPVHTPPKLQTWYMVGFGGRTIAFDSLKPSTYVYRWDDMRTTATGVGRYASRQELQSSEVGAGYWYFAEQADSLQTPVFSSLPAAVDVPVVHGGTGWNMVANPWNWPILLDSLHEYFVWDDSVGGYGPPVRVLYPYMGAWVNVTSESKIRISPQASFPGGENILAKRSLVRVNSPQDWMLQVGVVAGARSDSWNFFGVSAQALAGLDMEDGPEPPASLGEHVSLAFVGADCMLARDMRDPHAGASWKLALGADRARSAELQFTGIQALRAAGLRVMLVGADGTAREVPESGVVPVSLAKGVIHADIRVVEQNAEIQIAGGITDLQMSSAGERVLVRFRVPVAMAGLSASLSWTSLDGRVLARIRLQDLQPGWNEAYLPRPIRAANTDLLHVKVGKSQITTRVSQNVLSAGGAGKP